MIVLVKEVVYIPWHFVKSCWHPCSRLHIAATADYTFFVIDLHNTTIYWQVLQAEYLVTGSERFGQHSWAARQEERRRRRRRRSYQTKLKEFKLRPTDFAWFKSKQKLQGSEEDLKERSSNCSTPQSRGQIYKWRACRLPSGMKWNEMKWNLE